ncbi:MAG: NfeD family protein [Dehalococcoidales bacterium]|nr:NfeD family protein [Dehalococcoidales bacterium]
MNNKPRLIFAIVSTIIELILIVIAVVWGLPQLDVNIPIWVMILVMIAWLTYSVYTYRKGTKALTTGHIIGMQNMVGTKGKVVSILNPDGWVRIHGELWSATSVSGEIKPGNDVIVTGQNRLKLEVRDDSDTADNGTIR